MTRVEGSRGKVSSPKNTGEDRVGGSSNSGASRLAYMMGKCSEEERAGKLALIENQKTAAIATGVTTAACAGVDFATGALNSKASSLL